MFALNAFASKKACEPNRALSKSLHTIEYAKYAPEMSATRSQRALAELRPGSQSSVLCTMRPVSGPSAQRCCWRSTIEMRRSCGGWGGRKPERDSVPSVVHIIILEE